STAASERLLARVPPLSIARASCRTGGIGGEGGRGRPSAEGSRVTDPGGSAGKARGDDAVELREVLPQEGVALSGDLLLVVRDLFAVAGIEAADDAHAARDATERRKASAVECRVVSEVDEDLCRARVGTGVGVRDRAGG